MKNIKTALDYPSSLGFFGLDRYKDQNTGRFIEIRSSDPKSHAPHVNSIMRKIEQKDGVDSYMTNRLREHVAHELFRILLQPVDSAVSTVINDIGFGIDATASFGIGKNIAIDFTESLNVIPDKLSKTKDGYKNVEDGGSYPLVIFWIEQRFINTLLAKFEIFLSTHNLAQERSKILGLKNIILSEIISDKRPDFITSLHMTHLPDVQVFLQHILSKNLSNIIASKKTKSIHTSSI